MNKLGISTSIIFILIYLGSVSMFFFYSKTQGLEGSVDMKCSQYHIDNIDQTTGAQTGHYDNRNEFCYFYYLYVAPITYVITLIPFLGIIIMGCGMNGDCSHMQLYGFGALAVIGSIIFYSSVGYRIGLLISKIFSKSRGGLSP